MDGGENGDSYFIDQGDIVFDTGTTGVDKVTTGTNFTLAIGNGIENLTTTYAGGGKATLIGNEQNNALDGGSANDSISGGAGTDILKGNGGDDTLAGGTGRDNMTGGTGNDTFKFALGDSGATTTTFDTVFDSATGADHVDLSIFTNPPDDVAVAATGAFGEVANATTSFGLLLNSAQAEMNAHASVDISGGRVPSSDEGRSRAQEGVQHDLPSRAQVQYRVLQHHGRLHGRVLLEALSASRCGLPMRWSAV